MVPSPTPTDSPRLDRAAAFARERQRLLRVLASSNDGRCLPEVERTWPARTAGRLGAP